jgi:hypothetical protein
MRYTADHFFTYLSGEEPQREGESCYANRMFPNASNLLLPCRYTLLAVLHHVRNAQIHMFHALSYSLARADTLHIQHHGYSYMLKLCPHVHCTVLFTDYPAVTEFPFPTVAKAGWRVCEEAVRRAFRKMRIRRKERTIQWKWAGKSMLYSTKKQSA